jgi:hypothetical protein
MRRPRNRRENDGRIPILCSISNTNAFGTEMGLIRAIEAMRLNRALIFMLKLYHNTVTRLTAPISLWVYSHSRTLLIAHCHFAARGKGKRP